jgi:hypothetical protein
MMRMLLIVSFDSAGHFGLSRASVYCQMEVEIASDPNFLWDDCGRTSDVQPPASGSGTPIAASAC